MLITLEMIKGGSSHTKQRRQETLQEFLRRLTHLHLNSKHITKISALDECVNLEVLYLYDNEIKSIENLNALTKITHLYLQDNQITVISNLSHLSCLQKLSLDRLSQLESLEELHISSQKSDTPEPLSFEEQTLATLSARLTHLHCSANRLPALPAIHSLTFLDLSNNNFLTLDDLHPLLSQCTRLKKLLLKGNPVCKKREYREGVISMSSPALTCLDDKEITANERVFLEKKTLMKKPPSSPKPTPSLESSLPSPSSSVLSASPKPIKRAARRPVA